MAIGQSNDFLQASDQDTLDRDSLELEGLDQEQDEEEEQQTDFFSATPEDTIGRTDQEEAQETRSGATDFLNATESQEEEPQRQTDFFNATPEESKTKHAIDVGRQAQDEIFREMGIDPEDVPETRLQSNLNYFIQALGDVVEGGLKATSGFLDTIGGGEVKPIKDEDGNITGFEQNINPEDGLLYKAGEWVGNQLRETFPDNPKFRDEFLSKLSRGAGSLASQFGLAAATRGKSLLTQSKQAVSIGASFSGLEYSRALESGADPDTAFNTMLLNIPIHSLEQLPVLNATKKLDKATGGTFKQILKEGFKGGLYEGAQEVGVEFGSNLIAQNMYDETISMTEGLKDSGEVGFVLGMAMTGLGVPLRRMRDNPDATPQERAEAQKTLEHIENELQRLPQDVTDFIRQKDAEAFMNAVPDADEIVHKETILYHGTPEPDVTEFDESELGSATWADDAILGFHFSTNKDVADKVFGIGADPDVKRVKLNIEKSFNFDHFLGTTDPQRIKDFHYIMTGEKVKEGSPGYAQSEAILRGHEGTNFSIKDELAQNAEQTKKRLKELGYDSIVKDLTATDQALARGQGVEDTGGKEVIVLDTDNIQVLEPTEIKPIPNERIEEKAEELFDPIQDETLMLQLKGAYKRFVRSDKNPETSEIADLINEEIDRLNQENAIENTPRINKLKDVLDKLPDIHASRGELKKENLDRAFEKGGYQPVQTEQKPEDVTPEQSVNMISPKPDTFGGRIMKKMEQWLAPRGKFPKELREFFRTRPADVKVETRRMQRTIRDLNKRLKEEFNIGKLENAMFSKKIPQKLQDNMRKVLVGEAKPEILPEGIAESVSEMRNHIDRLSRSLIKNGVAEGDLEITFRKNMGYYVHRTYKVHNVDNWSEIVPESVKNRAKAFLRSQNPDASEAQIKNAIARLLNKETDPVSSFREGKLGSMDLSPLKRRQDIPAPIRELLGEETNAVVNYGKSVIKMANLLENHKTLTALRDKFEGKYFFHLDDKNIPEDAKAQLAGDQSDVMGPLSGMWTSPEIKEAFEEASTSFRDMSKTHRFILRLNAGAKFSKTILNPVTVGRNVVGGTGFLLASGNIPSKEHFKKGIQAAKDVFSNPNSKEAREAVDELIRLGITGKSAKAGEVNDLLNELTLEDNLDSTFEKLMGGKGLSTKGKRLVKMAGDFYQAGDDFLRIAMYYSNLQRYQNADPNITKEEVARITNDTYQNYDEAGNSKFVTAARRNPLVAPFLPFTYEVVRTTMNNYKLMKREISSDNKDIRRIGYSRLAGLSVAGGLGSVGASLASLAILGISDEEDKDVRRHSAPWDKTGTLLYADVDKSKGQATYFNLSYIDPYEYLKDPLLSLIVNDSEEQFMDQLKISMKEMFEPVLGPELFAQKAWEWTNNERSSGGRVYNPQAGFGQKTIDTMAHFWDAFEPGFLDWGGKVADASTNYRSDHSVSGQIASLFGFRPVTIDFEKSLEFKVNDFVQARRDAKRLYTNTLRDEEAGVVAEERSRQEANVAFRDDWDSLARDIEAARRMGVGVHKIKDVLESKNISQKDIRSLLYGSFQKFERDFETGR